jgi:hypothetical protein
MKGFTLLKHGDCPICNGARKDCRESNESGMVFCREASANPTGFIFRGLDKWGFGLWQPSEAAEAFAQKSKEEWQQEQEQRRIENEQRRQKQIASQLSAVDRNKFYRKLLAQLPVGHTELSDLENRGFTSEQIKADGYRSITQWQKVLGVFPSNLPGVLPNRNLNSQPGCIFPIQDVNGLIVALAIRLTDGNNGRYRWLTSATKKKRDGAIPHLNGELPLAVFEPSELQADAIWLTEGVGIKPSLTRYRLGVPVVGASGGLFSGSPNTCQTTLEKLSEKYQTKNLIIAIDAGDIKNAHVSHRWQGEINFLQSLGYQIKIAWWGQIDKTDPDIDELDDLSKIELISCEDFLGKETAEQNKNPDTKNQPESKSTLFDILNPPLTEPLPVISFNDVLVKVLPIPESVASIWSQEDETTRKKRRWFDSVLNRIKKVYSKQDKKEKQPRLGFDCFNEPNPEFEEKIRQVQRKLRSLSYDADIETHERYLPDDLVTQLPKSGLIGIKAPKGSGKSRLLKKIIALAKKLGITVLSITPRIALGREQAVKWEITWIDDYGVMQTKAGDTIAQIQEIANKREKAKKKLAELQQTNYQLNCLGEDEIEKLEQQKADLRIEIEKYGEEIENINASSIKTLALCWDSLWRTKDRDLKEALIVIDEAELGFKHFINGSTCKRNRPYLIQTFKEKLTECLMSGGRVILSDADLTDLPIDYVREILPIPIKPFIVTNDYMGEETRWIVDLRIGSRGDTLDDLMQRLEDEQYIAFTCDSQAEAEALEERILKEFPDEFCAFLDADGNITADAQAREKALIVRIDSTTSASKAGKNFVEHPNEQILHWKPRILIYTPSMGVGVSIDEDTQRWDEELEEMVPYFDVLITEFFGVIEPSECRQQMGRPRANIPRIVYVREFNRALEGCSSFFPDEIKRQTFKYSESTLSILDIAKGVAGQEADDEQIREEMLKLANDAWDKDSCCWKEPSIDLAAKFKARENYSKWNLANLLREELEDEGHTVVSIKGMKTHLVEEMSEIKEEKKLEKATLVSLSSVMLDTSHSPATLDTEEAKKVLYALGSTNEQRRSAQKTLLQDELPGIELTPEFIKKAVVDDHRRWLNQHRLFWYLTNFEAVKEKDTEQWLKSLKKFVKGTPFMRDIRSDSPKVKAILDSGVFEFVDLQDFARTYQGDTPEAKAFLKKCLKNKDDIQTALNILVTKKTSPIALANKILGKVGLGLEKLTKSKTDKRYCLSLDLLNDPDRAKALKAFDLRWQMSQDEIAQKMAEKQAQQATKHEQPIEQPIEQPVAAYQDEDVPLVVESQGVTGQTLDQVTEPSVVGQTFDQVVEQTTERTGSAPVDELIEAFPYCDSRETFAAVIERYSVEDVDTAILYSPLHIKSQLRKWWDAMCFPVKDFWKEAAMAT